MTTRWKFTWCWTNWTFGVWWLRGKCGGIDLGPFEILAYRRGTRR